MCPGDRDRVQINIVCVRYSSKLFIRAIEIKRTFSNASDSQELEPDSQLSNYSDCSDIEIKRVVNELEFMKKVRQLDSLKTFCTSISLGVPPHLSLLDNKVKKFMHSTKRHLQCFQGNQ